MKKQTISKIAAVALAAMTVVPMFGITASADIKLVQGSAATKKEAYMQGNAYRVVWSTKVITKSYQVQRRYDSTIDYALWELAETGTDIEQHVDPTSTAAVAVAGAGNLQASGTVYYGYQDIPPVALQTLENATELVQTNTKTLKKNVEDAIKAVNDEITGYYAAKKNAEDSTTGGTFQFTKADGTKYSVYKDGTGTVQYKNNSNNTVSSSYTITTNPTFKDETGATKTVAASSSSSGEIVAFNVHEYIITKDTKSRTMIELNSELGSSYAKFDTTAGKKYEIVAATANESGTTVYYLDTSAAFDSPTGNGGSGSTGTGASYQTSPNAVYRYYTLNSPYYYSSYYTASAAGGNAAVYDWVTGQKVYDPTTVYPSYSTSVSSTYRYIVAEIPYQYFKSTADAQEAARQKNITSPTIKDVYTDATYNPYGYLYGYGYGATTTATKDTSTVTIGNYKGWTYVTRYINNAKSGASYTVKMNSETEIPTNVLKALYGKNVTVNFKFNSGATLSIKGTDMASTSAISTNIRYVKNVPSALVSKAVKSNSGVSSAQFTVSGGSIGANASVTVKFSTSRSGKTATLYRYNASSNSLTKVSTSTVRSNGYCTLANVDKGGDYVIVLS